MDKIKCIITDDEPFARKGLQGYTAQIDFLDLYEKYALQGFELEVLDYLLKPIPFERFLRAANKAYDFFRGQQPATVPPMEDYIFVKADNKLEKIDFADILFAEALENYVAIYTREKKVITHLTLKMVQEKLPAAAFVQPHKSYMISIDKINSIEGNILHIGPYQVPISKYQKEEIMEKIVNSKLLKR
jgi:DNA-binding LytR/AlgR family response regulator